MGVRRTHVRDWNIHNHVLVRTVHDAALNGHGLARIDTQYLGFDWNRGWDRRLTVPR